MQRGLAGIAARIGVLQRMNCQIGNRQRLATVIVLADQIPLRLRPHMTRKAVAAKAVVHIGKTALANGGFLKTPEKPESFAPNGDNFSIRCVILAI